MTRTPPALTTLIRQVAAQREDATIELSDVDGYGRARTATFDDVTSEWLAPIIEALTDKRIASHSVNEGALSVTVVSTRQADDKSDFPLGDVEKVLSEPPTDLIEFEGRNAELREMKAGALRDEYPEYAELPNKDSIVEAILKDEFPEQF